MVRLFPAMLCMICACSGARADEAWRVRLDSVVARSDAALPEADVQQALARAWAASPLYAPAAATADEDDTLGAELGYWEVVDEAGARQLVVSLSVPTPEAIRAGRDDAPRKIEATVLLERDDTVPLRRDLELAVGRAAVVVDARTRLALGSAEQLQLLLGGNDPDLAALALEWVRDREQSRHLQDVLRLLDHPDEKVHLAAVEALGAVGGPEHARALLRRVQLEDPAHAHRLYEALADLGGPEAVAFLRFAAQNEDEPARRRAARSALRAADGRASVSVSPQTPGHRR